jgi:hypothetical protein
MWRPITFALIAAVILAPAPLEAATFVVPPDDEMIDQAEVIVLGQVQRSTARQTRGIRTYSTIRVLEVLKGAAPFEPGYQFEVSAMGGIVGGRALIVPGAPRYRQGKRVVVFLRQNEAGEWVTLHMALGKFRSERRGGTDVLVRGDEEEPITGYTPDGRPHREVDRDEKKFKDYVKEKARGRRPPRDYERGGGPLRIREPEAQVASIGGIPVLPQINTSYPASAYLMPLGSPALPARWRQWDGASPTAVVYRSSGTQRNQADSVGAFQRALAAWTNETNSSITFAYGGTTTATSGMRSDGINSVIFNDPSNEIAGSWTGSGVIATGRFWANLQTHTHRGETFYLITEGDVIVQDGVTLSTIKFDEGLTHELGHTLGFRHSNEARQPTTSSAVMNSSVVGTYGTSLQTWDRSAAAMVYGTGTSEPAPAPSCTPPAITRQPASVTIPSGGTTTLSVAATGTGLTYRWYRGTAGTTTYPMSSTSATFTTPASTTTQGYWVRVTGTCGAVNSTTATVTVQASCVRPAITTQPASKTIARYSQTQLSVAVTGSGPFTYEWYRGTAGTTTNKVGTGATYTTPRLSRTTYYWVRVRNACGYVNSGTATIRVR